MCEVRLLKKDEYLDLKDRVGFYFENELSDYAKLFINRYLTLKGENGIDGLAPYWGIEKDCDRDISYFWLDSDNENVVTFSNYIRKIDEASTNIGVKVLQDFNDLEDVTIKRNHHNHRICIWGEYPQTKATEEETKKLDRLLKLGFLGITGNVYTYNQNYKSTTTPEYEYLVEYEADDKKYVHLYEIVDNIPKSLWIEVEPVEWIVDNKTNLGISRRVLFGGLPLKDKNGNDLLKPFIEDTFNREIKPTEIYKQLTIKL